MIFEVTPFYAGLFLLWGIYLSVRIIRLRWRYKVGIGAGQQPELRRAIRVHGNFIEHIPLTLVGLALLEAQQLHYLIVHVLGVALFAGRVFHAFGLGGHEGTSKGRFIGMGLTFGVQLIIAMALILNFVHLVVMEYRA